MPITPDTKDWTWVLERPCDQCGFRADDFPAKIFGETIRAHAAKWVEVLQRDSVHVRPNENRWSPLEYACHVRDVYRLFDQRLTLMLIEDDPLFDNWDQDETARRHDYAHQVPHVVSEELLDAALTYARRFDGVEPTQWDRPGVRSNGSRFTVRSLGTYGLHDPAHHLWDVAATT